MLDKLVKRIESRLFEPRELPRAARALRVVLQFVYALLRDLLRDALALRAMSLVYTTLLSLVPLLAVVFSVLKGFGVHRDMEPALHQFFEPMGERGAEFTDTIMRFVNNARGDVLGTLGMAFLLYTAVTMIQKVEESFNMVWRVQEPRSVGRRIGEYLSVLIVGPVLTIPAIGIMAALNNSRAVRGLSQFEPFGTILTWFGAATPYLLVTCVFTFLYSFVPNTHVRFRAALIGGVVASVLWVGSGILFASFVSGATGTMLIYAGFAVVILALIWLHVSWLVLLVGAQLSFYVQHPQCLRPGAGEEQLTANVAERVALSVMYLLAQSFTQANAVRFSLNALAERLDIAVTALVPVVRRLEDAGLIVVTEADELIPGRDLESIQLIAIFDAVHGGVDRNAEHIRFVPAADRLAAIVDDAMRASMRAKTLKELIAEEASAA